MAAGDVSVSTAINPISFKGYYFDGVDYKLTSDSNLFCNYSAGFSWAGWFYLLNDNCHIWDERVSNVGVQPIYINTSSRYFQFFFGTTPSETFNSTTPAPLNEWFHYVVTWGKDKKVKMYLNGSLINTFDSVNYPQGFGIKKLTLGARHSDTNFFKGMIRDARRYNFVLTENEVLIIKNGFELEGINKQPLNKYNFKDGSLVDEMGKNNLTLSGAVFSNMEGTLNQVIKTQRATAGSTYKTLLTKVGNGQIISVFIDE